MIFEYFAIEYDELSSELERVSNFSRFQVKRCSTSFLYRKCLASFFPLRKCRSTASSTDSGSNLSSSRPRGRRNRNEARGDRNAFNYGTNGSFVFSSIFRREEATRRRRTMRHYHPPHLTIAINQTCNLINRRPGL